MTKFVPNPAAEKLLARTPQMVEALQHEAERGIAAARSIAPVETGAYRDGLVAEAGIDGGEAKGRMNAKDFKSHWIEFGTSKWAAHAVLRRAAESVGFKLTGGQE